MRGVFDIVGPVMIGPSSSHTAGAARLGKMARIILGERPVRAEIYLHGSFATTYLGHGTDKALIAGLLGFAADDERIRHAEEWAQKEGLTVSFQATDLGEVHPNTVAFVLYTSQGREMRIQGASIGGGNIEITEIAGYSVRLSGVYHTLMTVHRDRAGTIAHVTEALAQEQINIAFMHVSRQNRGSQALMIIETDQPIPQSCSMRVEKIENVERVITVPPVE